MGLRTVIYAQKFIPLLFKPKKCTAYNQKTFPSLFMGLQLTIEQKNFISSLVQRKNSYSWTPEILIVYKKLIYPSTYTKENLGTSMRRKTKKTYTSTHNETRGAVCIPVSSYCACMYKSLLFLYVCFYPTVSWVLYLNTEIFICPVRMKKITFLCLLWSRF